MTVQKKLPSDIEENIQNLAGDIYLQIEDKITALLSHYSDNLEITPEIITQHPLYITLKEQQQSHQQQTNQNQQEYSAQLVALQAEKAEQLAQLTQLQEDLSKAEQLNTAKLADSEHIFKDKLAQSSQLAKQVATLSQENTEQKQLLQATSFETETINEQLKTLAEENIFLAKNDQAKAATLAVQNQQYSALQLNFEQVSSELEYLKAEQEHKLLASHKQLSHEQQQAEHLSKQIAALQHKLENKQVALDQQQEILASKDHENNDLIRKINNLTQTVAQLEKNDKAAQLQYEAQKQQINTKWLNKQEKNAKILAQASDDNERILKQIHDAERSKQAIERELANVNGELAAVNKQHLQMHDTEQALEEKLQKEQAVTTKLNEEKMRLEASLVQAQQEYNTANDQQKQKNTDLTKQLAQIVIEQKNAQQTIANLAQKNQAQSEEITLIVEQAKHQQFEFQQTVTEHQLMVTDKTAALIALQQQADKTTQALSQQLSSNAEQLAAESAKLAALQRLHDKTLTGIEKTEQNLGEKQQQLAGVQAELAEDRATTEKNRLLQQAKKAKQAVEYNQARETIKYLRDENTELNRKLDQQVSELEDKLTEYRLRFDYAQKQLTKFSK